MQHRILSKHRSERSYGLESVVTLNKESVIENKSKGPDVSINWFDTIIFIILLIFWNS